MLLYINQKSPYMLLYINQKSPYMLLYIKKKFFNDDKKLNICHYCRKRLKELSCNFIIKYLITCRVIFDLYTITCRVIFDLNTITCRMIFDLYTITCRMIFDFCYILHVGYEKRLVRRIFFINAFLNVSEI
jgi:hypothetical protein